MTAPDTTQAIEQKPNDKEINFRKLEERYERALAQERAAREEAEKRALEAQNKRNTPIDDEEDDSEPYVDKKKLARSFSNFEKKMEEKIEKKAEERARSLIHNERKENWMKNNPDFYEVMAHTEKFALHDPELAETILQMPEGFERQKLVYKSIKSLGLHKEAPKQPSIQETIDAKKRSPYYQPTGTAAAPYGMNGDFSKVGQKNAYEKMMELKSRLRLG